VHGLESPCNPMGYTRLGLEFLEWRYEGLRRGGAGRMDAGYG